MPTTVLAQAEEKMNKVLHHLEEELTTIRTGRANPSALSKITVEYYGVPTPLNQVANVTVPEARMLLVTPYDRSIVGAIDKAIQDANLGFNPTNDGSVIRIAIPALTEERRKEMVKKVKSMAETAKVGVRNARRDANDALKKLDITEDEVKSYQDDVQKLTDTYVKKADEIAKAKEADVMTV
ncbi:MAG: ribosome recycling factor [Culicoidibacterales bacterium]